jgi:hypothetical protein
MKKLIFTSFLLVAMAFSFVAYATDTFITGFEVGDTGCQVNDEWGAWFQGYTWSYVTNSQTSGVNNSSRCLMADSSTQPGNQDSWGFWVALKLANPITITAENRYLKIMAKRSPNTTGMSVGTDVFGERGYYGRHQPSVAGTWGDMVIDLFDAGSTLSLENKQITKIFVSLGTWDGLEKGVCFLDNVVLSDNSKPRGAKEVKSGVIANFDNETLTATSFASILTQSADASYQVAANPVTTPTNDSKKCLLYKKPANTVWWNALICYPNDIIPVTYPNIYMHCMLYIPDLTPTTIIYSATSGANVTTKNLYPADGSDWSDFVVDVSSLDYINQIAFRFNQSTEDNWANPAGMYYVDDIVLNNNPDPRTKITSGVKYIAFDNLKIYSKDGNVIVSAPDLKAVSIYSIGGQLLFKQVTTGSVVTCKLPNGSYIIKAENKTGGISAHKFVM